MVTDDATAATARAQRALTPGQRLAAQAAEAAEVRTWQTHPDVVALQVERTRTLVDRLMWGGIVSGLAFTMVNIQQFAARTTGATPGTLGWWAAWLLDPTVAAILLGILIAERRVAPGQIKLDRIARVAKWVLLAATYVMNTWESYATGSVAGVVLHRLPPLVVFLAAEVLPGLHERLTASVYWARDEATSRAERSSLPAAISLISNSGPSEPCSGGLGRPESNRYPPAPKTWTAPLDRSGNPAGPTLTVVSEDPDRLAHTAVADRSQTPGQTGPGSPGPLHRSAPTTGPSHRSRPVPATPHQLAPDRSSGHPGWLPQTE